MKIRNAITRLRDETGLSRKECIAILAAEDKIRLGGNTTNGLLANVKGGASFLINSLLAHEDGISVKELRDNVSQCEKVKHPDKKIAEHLHNCQEYARSHRLNACDLREVLIELDLLSDDGTTVPAVCINSIPEQNISLKIVTSWPENAILTSPLLAAIRAYEAGKSAPSWVRSFIDTH